MSPNDFLNLNAEEVEHPLLRLLLSFSPHKTPQPASFHIEEAPVPLAVDIQSQETPDGVPLHQILDTLQRDVPEVGSLHVRGRTLMVTYNAPPSDEDRGKVAQILSSPAQMAPPREMPAREISDSDLLDRLRDPALPDQDWLQLFRRYALAHLLKEQP